MNEIKVLITPDRISMLPELLIKECSRGNPDDWGNTVNSADDEDLLELFGQQLKNVEKATRFEQAPPEDIAILMKRRTALRTWLVDSFIDWG